MEIKEAFKIILRYFAIFVAGTFALSVLFSLFVWLSLVSGEGFFIFMRIFSGIMAVSCAVSYAVFLVLVFTVTVDEISSL